MKVFAIFLCIAISYVFGELERKKFQQNLKVNEDIIKVDSRVSLDDAKQTSSPDEDLQEKYAKSDDFVQISASGKYAASVKKKALTNLYPVILTSTMKPTSSKAIKNLEIMYLMALMEDNHASLTRPRTAQKNYMEFLKSFLRDKDAVSPKEKNLASNTGKLLRRKREITLDRLINCMKDTQDFYTVLDSLPKPLSLQLRHTNGVEFGMLQSYTTLRTASSKIIADYDAALAAERAMLKEEQVKNPSRAADLLAKYKSLRTGKKSLRLECNYEFFDLFNHSSPALTEFETVKRHELASLDSLDTGSPQSTNEEPKHPQAEEKDKSTEKSSSTEDQVQKTELAKAPKEKETAPAAEMAKAMDSKPITMAKVTDPKNSRASCKAYLKIRNELPAALKRQVRKTDDAEKKILISYAKSKSAPSDLIDGYEAAKAAERKALKKEVAEAGSAANNIIDNYKALRKGKPWNYIKRGKKFKKFFKEHSAALTEYETLKADELSIDKYLNSPSKSTIVEENTESKTEEDNKKVRAKIAERTRTQEEDESAEEMERGMRARDIKTVEVDEAIYRESVEDIVATIDATKEDIETHASPDSITPADVTIAETTTKTKVKDNSQLLRFAILFALIMQMIIAFLILGPQSDKLVAWCNKRNRIEADPAETEALYAGKKSPLLELPLGSRRLLSTSP